LYELGTFLVGSQKYFRFIHTYLQPITLPYIYVPNSRQLLAMSTFDNGISLPPDHTWRRVKQIYTLNGLYVEDIQYYANW